MSMSDNKKQGDLGIAKFVYMQNSGPSGTIHPQLSVKE